ncbi:MAG: Lrp/AsnC family transcriptional regulator [Bacteroidales bacterium]|jgi:Lrp/AsnC family transcriptional regulator for asnA, asnC and gidA
MGNNSSEKIDIDKTDSEIISVLLKDAKRTYSEIAEQLGISTSTVHIRIKKLEALNIIKGYNLKVDFAKLGMSITAFIGFTINPKLHKEITAELLKIEEIVDLHHTTGNFHMLAKLICKDSEKLKEILQNNFTAIAGIEKTETMISLEEILHSY